jgi:hypothetical protein
MARGSHAFYVYSVGDLVRFDVSNMVGIVTAVKNAPEFVPPDKVSDVKVRWVDGEEFWCLDFTLQLLSSIKN